VSDQATPIADPGAVAADVTDPADGSEDQVMPNTADTVDAPVSPGADLAPDTPDTPEAPMGIDPETTTPGDGTVPPLASASGSLDATDPAGSPDPPDPVDTPPPTDRRRGGAYRMAIVSAVTMDLPHQHPAVVLRETESPRRQLTFSVGLQDGIALAYALRRIATPRPLTHELMGEVLAGFDIDVVAVRLVGRTGTTYFAELDLRGRNARSVHSCRPTDALTIALRQPVPVPILIDARLLESSGDVEPPSPAD
jgi:uncharacterized protein